MIILPFLAFSFKFLIISLTKIKWLQVLLNFPILSNSLYDCCLVLFITLQVDILIAIGTSDKITSRFTIVAYRAPFKLFLFIIIKRGLNNRLRGRG